MEDGCHGVGMFLGNWFIRKCMNELEYVSNEDYKYLCDTIKKHINDWIDEVNEYNNF